MVQHIQGSDAMIKAEAAATAEIAQLKAEVERAHQELQTLSLRVRRLSNDFAMETKRSQNISTEFDKLKDKFYAFEMQAQYLRGRSIVEKLFFRVDGRPIKPLRRLLFHNSGKPRSLFRILVQHRNGDPRRAFSYWLKSKQSEYTPQAQAVAVEAVPSPRERYFLTRLLATDYKSKDN